MPIREFAKFSLIAICHILCTAACLAADPSWQTSFDEGLDSFTNGLLNEAAKHFQKSLKQAEQFGNKDMRLGASLNNLAATYVELGRYSEAETLFKRALEIKEANLGPNSPEIATSLINLATVYRKPWENQKAQKLLQQALSIREQSFGKVNPMVAISLRQLARFHENEHDYDSAEKLYNRALQIRQNAFDSSVQDITESLTDLARLYFSLGKTDRAVAIYLKTIKYLNRSPSATIVDLSKQVDDLSWLYEWQGKYRLKHSLRKRYSWDYLTRFAETHHLSPPSKVVFDHRRWISEIDLFRGFNYWKNQEPAKPEDIIVDLKKAQEAQATNPMIASEFSRLAEAYLVTGEYDKAISSHKHALQLFEQSGNQYINACSTTLKNLAYIYEIQNQHVEAQLSMERRLKLVSTEHLERSTQLFSEIDCLLQLGTIYTANKKYADAEKLYRKALSLSKYKFANLKYATCGPPEHQIIKQLADLYRLEGRFSESESCYKRVIDMWSKNIPISSNIAMANTDLADLYREQRYYAEAEKFYLKAKEYYDKYGDHHFINTVNEGINLHGLGLVYKAIGKLNEGKKCLEHSLSILESRSKDMHKRLSPLEVTKLQDTDNRIKSIQASLN